MSDTAVQARSVGSEGGHWYNEDGLVVSVPKADGKGETKPTLRHARKLGLLPSVTSIIGIMPKPGLDKWKCQRWALASQFVEREAGETDNEWLIRVGEQVERMNDYAAIGTDVHAELAKCAEVLWHRHKLDEYKPPEELKGVCEWLLMLFHDFAVEGVRQVKIEQAFCARELGYGGTVDLFVETDNAYYYIDYKTADDEKVKKQDKYLAKPEHLMQLEAYCAGTMDWRKEDKPVRLINLYIGRLSGEWYEHEWTDIDAGVRAIKQFMAARDLWQVINNYITTK